MPNEKKNENAEEIEEKFEEEHEEETAWPENISEAERRKMRETAAEGFEINIYNPKTGKWICGGGKK